MQAKNLLIPVLLPVAALTAQAQQTFAVSSICDNARVTLDGGGVENSTLPNLCDRNDLTAFVAEQGAGLSVIVATSTPWVAKGIIVVAGEDPAQAPSQITLYGKNEADGSWTRIGRFNSVKYLGPYTSYTGKTLASQTGAYREFKFEVNKVAEGNTLCIADMQILGYPQGDEANIAVDLKGAFSASESTDNLWAIGGENFTSATTIKNARVQYGVDNAWIDFTFDSPEVLSAYAVTMNATSAANMRPNTWDFMASEDGENWVTLDMRNNEASFDIDNYMQRYDLPSRGPVIDFAAEADKLYEVMFDKFWVDCTGGKYLLHAWNADPEKINRGKNYWWMAHVIDGFTDTFKRTGKQIWRSRAIQVKQGLYGGGTSLWNTFYDDMEWMAIACINAYNNYTIDRNVWLDEARQLFDWIWMGWSDVEGGGIGWNTGTGKDSKNSCSNAPAIIIAARLYQITGEEHYLEKAKMIFDWMLDHSRFDDGFIKDGPHNEIRGWAFTYNQGTWVGGLLELFKITGEEKYREIAVDLMDKSLDGRWYTPHGIMREQGSSDGGLFKGIYVRYITEWITSGHLDAEHRYRYAKFLVENAKSLYLSSLIKPEYKVMPCWQSREDSFNGENNGGTDGSYHASILESGIFLFESVDLLRREGILNDDYSVKNENIGQPFSHYRLRFTDNQGGSNLQLGGVSLYGEDKGASLNSVSSSLSHPVIKAADGAIEVSGAAPFSKITVTTTDGRIVAVADGVNDATTIISVIPGFYIVNVTGASNGAAKLHVK